VQPLLSHPTGQAVGRVFLHQGLEVPHLFFDRGENPLHAFFV
jgi:hypothetical protein